MYLTEGAQAFGLKGGGLDKVGLIASTKHLLRR